MADDFCLFQELAKRVADTFHIPLEEVRHHHHQLIDILHCLRVIFKEDTVIEAILDLAKMVWKTLESVAPICKLWIKNIMSPQRNRSSFFSHLPLSSIMVDVVNSHG